MLKKLNKMVLMTALLITLFMCVFNSTEVKAESYNNGVYETTIDGKITINYTVEGRFGEYSKTAIDGNGTHWRCDGLILSNTTSFDVPVKVTIRRNANGQAEYSTSVNKSSDWDMRQLCKAPGADESMKSWLIVQGNANFNFTSSGTHDLTDVSYNSAKEASADLTSKGCTFNVTKIYDNNPDWVVDKQNWTKKQVNSITLSFTYPAVPDYRLTFDPNGGTFDNQPHGNLYKDNRSNWVTVQYDYDWYTSMSGDIPYKEHYTFNGWYMYHSDGSWYEQIYDSSGNCINSTSLWGHWDNRWHYRYNGDVTLYAGWTPDNYTLTFDPNGGTLRNPGSNLYNPQWNNGNRVTVTYDAGNFCSMSDDCPTRTGYTFTGWYLKDSNGSLFEQIYDAAGNAVNGTSLWGHWDNNWHWRYAGDVTVYAGWKANPDTSYTVRHWKQKLYIDNTTQYTNADAHNETNYFIADTDNLKGTTDSQVTPAIRNYEGFTAPDVQTVTIKPDGSLVVDYYYTRNRYKIDDTDNNDSGNDTGNTDSDKGNGIDKITGGGEYFFEEEVTMQAYVKTGYHWHNNDDCHTDISRYPTGWTVTKTGCGIDRFLDGTGYGSQKIKFIMPAHDVYVKADATNNSYTIAFDNNGGTGTMPQVSATYDVPVTLPANTFTRTTEAGTSTFLYWKFKDNNYVDNSVVNNLTSDFNGNVTLTAIWDDTPVITAQERYFTVEDSQSGRITLEELLSTAKVTDDWDDDIAGKLTVKNYHAENYTQFKTDGAVKIVYTATDSSGNVAEVSVMAHIVDTVAVEEEKDTYVRFIGPDYYKESYENGGLEENSIWRNDHEYAATLERAMQNRLSMTYGYNEATFFNIPIKAKKAASESRDHLVEQWVFTKQDIKAVKEYVNEHGIGNMKELDALAKFRIQFAHCKKQ